jgi:hypothetical protein
MGRVDRAGSEAGERGWGAQPSYSHLAPDVHKGGHVPLILGLIVREHHCVADVPGVGAVGTSRGVAPVSEGSKGGADVG